MNLLLLMPISLVLLSIIVVIHELGHFFAAKKVGVWVEEFGVGFPPKAIAKKFGETIYSLNWLPIGGFVRLHGETYNDPRSDQDRAFVNKGMFAKIFVAVAGIIMNFVLALVCFSFAYSFEGIEKQTPNVRITSITSKSPAQNVGMIVDDVVRKVNKTEITSVEQFISVINENKGKRVTIEFDRTTNGQKETKQVTVTPRQDPPKGEGALGVAITNIEIYWPPVWQRPFWGMYRGLTDTVTFSKQVVFGFGKIGQDISSGKAPEGLVGIVGILGIFSQMFTYGILPAVKLMGVISLNLAIINLLPFPPLDGSRVMFAVIEKVFGKKWVPQIEAKLHPIGMVLLLLLMIMITGRELVNLFQAGSLNNFVDTLIK